MGEISLKPEHKCILCLCCSSFLLLFNSGYGGGAVVQRRGNADGYGALMLLWKSRLRLTSPMYQYLFRLMVSTLELARR